MPAPALQPAQPHTALIWLIRCTGFIIVAPLILVLVVAPIGIMRAIYGPGLPSWMLVFVTLLAVLIYGVIVKVGYAKFRKVQVISVANFAFIFAYLAAKDLYHLLPLNLPKFIADYVGDRSPFLSQDDSHGISYRTTLAFIAFLIFYNVIKHYLEQVLELNPPNPPQNLPPSDPDVPEEPFVPFDPYDLSKNSPYHPQ
jgi:hypothetical protein